MNDNSEYLLTILFQLSDKMYMWKSNIFSVIARYGSSTLLKSERTQTKALGVLKHLGFVTHSIKANGVQFGGQWVALTPAGYDEAKRILESIANLHINPLYSPETKDLLPTPHMACCTSDPHTATPSSLLAR